MSGSNEEDTSACFRLEAEDEPRNVDCGDGLQAALLKARRDGLCFDVELRCGNSSQENLPAHRLILASRSDYMKALISSDRFADSSSPVIHLPAVSHRAMSHILNWMYGEEVAIPSVQEAYELAEASSLLQCVELIEIMHCKMTDVVTLENCVALWKLADRLHMEELAQKAQLVAANNFSEFVKEHESDFLSLDLDMLLELLDRKKLSIDGEEALFTSTMKWCKAKRGANALPENAMEQVLTRVQFSDMSVDFYTSQVEMEPLIRDNLSCLRVIARASVERGIEGQSTSKKKRKLLTDIDDFEVGMRVKVIDDVLTLKRLCREGDDRYPSHIAHYGWNDIMHQIAGKWYDVVEIEKDPPILTLSSGNWTVPVEAVEW